MPGIGKDTVKKTVYVPAGKAGVWTDAAAVAKAYGVSLSDLFLKVLEEYVAEHRLQVVLGQAMTIQEAKR